MAILGERNREVVKSQGWEQEEGGRGEGTVKASEECRIHPFPQWWQQPLLTVSILFLDQSLRGPAKETGYGSCLARPFSLGYRGSPHSIEGIPTGNSSGTGCRSLGPVECQDIGRLNTNRNALPRSEAQTWLSQGEWVFQTVTSPKSLASVISLYTKSLKYILWNIWRSKSLDSSPTW